MKITCPACEGTGKDFVYTCLVCGGEGEIEREEADAGGRSFGEPRTMYDWRGPRPDWYTGPLRSEGDPPPEDA